MPAEMDESKSSLNPKSAPSIFNPYNTGFSVICCKCMPRVVRREATVHITNVFNPSLCHIVVEK